MSVTLHTSLGDVLITLHTSSCPLTSFNFLALCAAGLYDRTLFHRNVPQFLIQGGDPTGSGKGGASIFGICDAAAAAVPQLPADGVSPSTTATLTTSAAADASPLRFFQDEGFGETFHARRGTVSMAHRGTKAGTNASQFFILYQAQTTFDGVFTSFGQVAEESLGVLDKMEKEGDDGGFPVVLKSVTVTYNPFAMGDIPTPVWPQRAP